jgi:hypothetical protein
MKPNSERITVAGLALAGALIATSVAATEIPFQCTTNGLGSWTVTAVGPTPFSCNDDTATCTRMTYKVTRNLGRSASNVAVLVDHDTTVITPGSSHVAPPCDGEGVTKIGIRDCSHKAVSLFPEESGDYVVEAEGDRAAISSSIVLKKGNVIEECRIASLGSQRIDPNAQMQTAQQVTFKGCTVTIPVDPVTGEPGVATIEGDNCVFVANAEGINSGELKINGIDVGTLTYGEGSVSSGESSCTTKVVNRRLYTWCTCADTDGDGVPNDPIPPCPATLPTN